MPSSLMPHFLCGGFQFCSVLFQPVHNADFIVPVEIDGTIHQVITV